jgi:hypothetical protein
MMKRTIAVLIVLSLSLVFVPTVSHAAVTPYFMAYNDTLLAFNDEHMPIVSGGEYFVPVMVFAGLGIHAIGSDELERVRLYRGASRYLDFFTARGVTEDQDGNTLFWPAARRIGRRFYVPLRQVCDYFGLVWERVAIDRAIIPEEQMWVIRIISSADFNGLTFVGLNRDEIRAAYNEYFAPPLTPSPPPPGEDTPPPEEEPPPDYSDVTIFMSFYNISAGSVEWILDLLSIKAASGYYSCFFVSSDDIMADPGLIRRISGSGHTVGIWLTEGTYDEYLEISALLFEAAKIRTVLVSADESAEEAIQTADEHGLVFWGGSQNSLDYDTLTIAGTIALIPTEEETRASFIFSCAESTALLLSGLYAYLRVNEYMVESITETVEPIV